MSTVRLQKFLSQAGVASRRQAEVFISQGKVKVNNQTITQLGIKINPEKDIVLVNNQEVSLPQKELHYYAYYKPRGLVVTKKDELGRKTIFDELKLPPQVNYVGRLDKDSEGLLLLTDDGEFIQRYTHPSFQIPKVYEVQISRPLRVQERQKLLQGILIDEKHLKAFSLKKINNRNGFWIKIEIHEGIKREVRRMMEYFGITVKRLIRLQHGSYQLNNMKPGELIELQVAEE